MNDDWRELFKKYVFEQTYGKNYSWDYRADDLVNQLYKHSMEPEMPYNRYDRYNNTRGDEVATAVLDAYASGMEFETLIKKNSLVRQYWYQVQSDKASKLKEAEQQRVRREKAAAARVAREAAKAEALKKLSPEEIEAFGIGKRGKSK